MLTLIETALRGRHVRLESAVDSVAKVRWYQEIVHKTRISDNK